MKKKIISSCILVLFFGVCLCSTPVYAFDLPIYEENFEGSTTIWSADNGVWEVGVPTGGPGASHAGSKCAGTILADNYPPETDSRLIGPYRSPWDQGISLPPLEMVNEEIHLRFWNWFRYSTYDSGQVQISVQNPSTEEWGVWVNVGNPVVDDSGGWSLKDVDLTGYAGQTVRIGFLHVAGRIPSSTPSEGPGWYIDDILVIKKIPTFTGDFEMGWVDWSASTGVWQIGSPSGGPVACYSGDQCVGTVLDVNYPSFTDSRLVSATVAFNEVVGNEEIHLRFWNWFRYSGYDSGQVQISVQNPATGEWGGWVNVGNPVVDDSGGWSLKDVDFTGYAGQTVRIGFLHVAGRIPSSTPSEGPGWYIDDILVIKKIPTFTSDFEMGWMGWSAGTGVWQIGTPSSGPGTCYEGEGCAGTVLAENYPAFTDSILVSATVDLLGISETTVYLGYWEWFSYSSYDYGEVRVSVWDDVAEEWADWYQNPPLNQITGTSPVWTKKYLDLSSYSGKKIRIGFFHVAGRIPSSTPSESHGWFIDNLEIVGPTEIMPKISGVSFSPYIPDLCTSLIHVFANEPFGADLTYTWQLPDGGTLMGTGENMEFIPPEINIEPYRILVAALSNTTHISSFTKTLKIFTEVLYDLDGDEDIDGADLRKFIQTEVIDEDTTARIAEEFGMIACQ